MTAAPPVVLVDTPVVKVVHDPESESFDVTLSGYQPFDIPVTILRPLADTLGGVVDDGATRGYVIPGGYVIRVERRGASVWIEITPPWRPCTLVGFPLSEAPEVLSALRLAVERVAPSSASPVEIRPNPAPPRRSGRTGAPDAKPVTLSRTCAVCNGVMTLKRSHAATCSPRCRQRLSRERRGLAPKPVGVVVFRRRRGGAR